MMKIRHILSFLTLVLLAVTGGIANARDYKLTSPDGQVAVTVSVGDSLTWTVSRASEQLLKPSAIGLDIRDLGGKALTSTLRVVSARSRSVDELLDVAVPTKFSTIRDYFNELRLRFGGGWGVTFRAYDNGVAYRFETEFKKDAVHVNDETSVFDFADDCTVYWAFEKSPEYITHCEAFFQPMRLSELDGKTYSYLPLSMETSAGTRLVLTETDLHDYPSQFLHVGGAQCLVSHFPKEILKREMRTDRDVNVLKKAEYLAETSGTRTYPWRVMTIGDDRSLLENTLPWQLASPQVEGDASWIKPGKISWEWWCMLNVYGVPFTAGVNTETYKYYIDFAAHYGLEYILMDEGWSAGTLDITHPKEGLDLAEIIEYGKSKGVGVVLWALWTPLWDDMEHILDTYRDWGVKGVKVDFMQMNDRNMVNFYERLASECFKRQLLVDFHGSFKPNGLHRKYPNVLSYEGVYGMEHDKCSNDISPKHDLRLPFTRMVAGPMDYTPGATINATRDDFSIRWNHPMSQGTRAHQAAIFVVFESPVQMLCDSPSNYYKEDEFTSFIASIPTTWDEIRAIKAKAGEYLLLARRKGDTWYVGAMNDWTPRELTCPLDFLAEGRYKAEIFADGVNADKWAEDYSLCTKRVSATDTLSIRLAPGGGYAAIIRPTDGPLSGTSDTNGDHCFIVVADPQVYEDSDVEQSKMAAMDIRETVANEGLPAFGVVCGDIIGEIKREPLLFVPEKEALESSGIPFHYVLGNHDIRMGTRSNELSKETFRKIFGKEYYSFDEGDVHYVVLDDVFYYARHYAGYIEESQLVWLENDLRDIKPGSKVVIFIHIPTWSREARAGEYGKEEMNKIVGNRRELYRILEPYDAHLCTAHEHYAENYELSDSLFEHVHAPLSGLFWQSFWSMDGVPWGYYVYTIKNGDISWYYKAVGQDKSVQYTEYAVGEDRHKPDCIVANVWNYDPKWQVLWYEDGVLQGEMTKFSGWDTTICNDVDLRREKEFRWKYIGAGETQHLFYAKPSRPDAKLEIKVVDRFGNVCKPYRY